MASSEEIVDTPATQDEVQEESKDAPKDEFKQPAVPPTKTNVEKEQEAKLRAKYPGLRGPGSNPLLQKRLSKGQKYFDSGDYNMAKASKKPIPPGQKLLLGGETGQEHPTPDTIPSRKTSLIHGNLS